MGAERKWPWAGSAYGAKQTEDMDGGVLWRACSRAHVITVIMYCSMEHVCSKLTMELEPLAADAEPSSYCKGHTHTSRPAV